MNTVLLKREDVEQIVASAESENEALEKVYKLLYESEWDNIKKINGWPACNEYTWKAIINMFIGLTDRLNKSRPIDREVLPGGPWLNRGFQVLGGEQLGDWQVMPAPYEKETNEETVS